MSDKDDQKLQEACWNRTMGTTSKEEDELIANAPHGEVEQLTKLPAVADRNKAFEEWMLVSWAKAALADCRWRMENGKWVDEIFSGKRVFRPETQKWQLRDNK